MMSQLFTQLIQQEMALHQPEVRQNEQFLQSVLHDDFFEFCRSGVTTDKADTLDDLLRVESITQIYSENFVCSLLSDDVILMTYLSYQLENDQRIKITHRSSIWVKMKEDQWQLRFHQGTPTT